MAREWVTFDGAIINEDGKEEYISFNGMIISEDQTSFSLYIGTDFIQRVYIGSDEIFKIYEGSTLIWEK